MHNKKIRKYNVVHLCLAIEIKTDKGAMKANKEFGFFRVLFDNLK